MERRVRQEIASPSFNFVFTSDSCLQGMKTLYLLKRLFHPQIFRLILLDEKLREPNRKCKLTFCRRVKNTSFPTHTSRSRAFIAKQVLILYRGDHFFKYYVPVKPVVQFELFSLGNGYRHWRMQVVIFGPRLKFCAAMYGTQIIH